MTATQLTDQQIAANVEKLNRMQGSCPRLVDDGKVVFPFVGNIRIARGYFKKQGISLQELPFEVARKMVLSGERSLGTVRTF